MSESPSFTTSTTGVRPWLHVRGDLRTWWLLWPREHGAWGMLLVPFLTGAWVARPALGDFPALLFFILVSLALFCLRTPLEVWLGASPLRARTSSEKRLVLYAILFYCSVAALALLRLLSDVPAQGLLWLASAAVVAALAQAPLKKSRGLLRMIAQVIGAVGLTSTAAGAYYVVARRLDRWALVLWAMNWVFVVNQIFFVQLRIRAAQAGRRVEKFRHGRDFLLCQGLIVLLSVLAWLRGVIPPLALAAFAPVLIRGMVWFVLEPKPLEIRRLGKSELFHALAFAVLLLIGFHR